jgi:hypothetical protein
MHDLKLARLKKEEVSRDEEGSNQRSVGERGRTVAGCEKGAQGTAGLVLSEVKELKVITLPGRQPSN